MSMLAYFFILLGAVLRVVPHAANFAPIGAIALFGGAYLPRRYALAAPLAAMLVSDFFIGFDSLQSRAVVYGSFLLIGGVGLLLRNRVNAFSVAGGSLAASVIFFLVTNLPFVHANSLYPYTLDGTLASYANALPFFRNTLFSDLLYTAAFFGAYEAVRAWKSGRIRLNKLNSDAHQSQSPS